MWNKPLFASILLGLIVVGGIQPALGDGEFQMHGFASQTAVHTTANNFGGQSEDGVSWDMRELGLNASYRLDADWMLSGQALARWAGASDDGDLRVDYAFLDRTLATGDGYRVGLQIGKVKNPVGLYNTTRDVAHTRPGILMPQSIYLDQIRNFFLAAPGVSLSGDHFTGNDSFEWTFNVMRPEVDDKALTAFMVTAQPGHFEGNTSWLGQVIWNKDGGRWKTGLTLGSVAMKFHATPTDVLSPGSIRLDTGTLSLQHNLETVSLTAEYSLTHQSRGPFGVPALDLDTTVEAAYVQGEWRFKPDWRVYGRYEAFYIDQSDRNGQDFHNNYAPWIPAHQRFSRDRVLGIRWDLPPSWALSAELHDLDGTAWLPDLDQVDPLATQQRWRMLLLQAAYRF